MPRRTGRLPAEYMKTAWWVYRHPLRAAGGVAGAFALAAIFAGHPRLLLAARQGAPLAIALRSVCEESGVPRVERSMMDRTE